MARSGQYLNASSRWQWFPGYRFALDPSKPLDDKSGSTLRSRPIPNVRPSGAGSISTNEVNDFMEWHRNHRYCLIRILNPSTTAICSSSTPALRENLYFTKTYFSRIFAPPVHQAAIEDNLLARNVFASRAGHPRKCGHEVPSECELPFRHYV